MSNPLPPIARVFITSVLAIGFLPSVFAQISHGGQPLHWGTPTQLQLNWKSFDALDIDALEVEDNVTATMKDAPWRFGIEHSVDWTMSNSGNWSEEDGYRVWRLAVRAQGATSLSFYLSRFVVPEGGELFVYNAERTSFLGSYTDLNVKDWEGLALSLTKGDKAILEYREPLSMPPTGEIAVGQVVQGYRSLLRRQEELQSANAALGPFGNSGSCNINVNCPEGDEWQVEKKAVALIVNGGFAACTGALVNNTANDGTPYFLTANHCLGNPNVWTYYFNHESATCSGSTGPQDNSISGGTLLVADGGSDVALVELSSTPPSSWDVEYAGWDATGDIPTSATGIHHPSGDVKKICFEENSPYYDVTGGAQVWWIDDWELGVTEPGSSGSPLFDQNHRIIGQLFGGAAACSGSVNNGAYDFYGRFNVSWDLGVSQYLDPTNSGVQVLDGYPTGFNSDEGCTDPTACNYSPEAIFDNGTCTTNDLCGECGGDNSSCSGCTDLSACNYDAEALIDNGSCTSNDLCGVCGGDNGTCSGCTDPSACNYDEAALLDDGSCIFGGTGVTLTMFDSYGDGWNGNSLTIGEEQFCFPDALGDCASTNVFTVYADSVSYDFCIDLTTCLQITYNNDGPYVNETSWSITDASGTILAQGGPGDSGFVGDCGLGCTNPSACNYDADASADDGSCDFECIGCTDPDACNYDATATQDDGSCLTNDDCGVCGGDGSSCTGCTNPEACNYDAAAIFDDGSCLTSDDCGVCGGDNSTCTGCTDPEACNYDPNAIFEDGSCVLGGEGLTISILTDNYPTEISWNVVSALGDTVATGGPFANSNTEYIEQLCLDEGCYTFTIVDSYGDGICCLYGDGAYSISSQGVVLATGGDYDQNESTDLCLGSGFGCTDPLACNYDAEATSDNGTCDFESCSGCTDPNACNYDAEASSDSGNCDFDSCLGCTDPEACNYDPNAILDDGSCVLGGEGLTISILTDNYPTEISWNVVSALGDTVATGGPFANSNTEYIEQLCLDEGCYTFTIVDSYGDGICCLYGDGAYSISSQGVVLATGGDYDQNESTDLCLGSGFGCTDPLACNYDAEATSDNGTCDFESCSGCTDPNACNYDAEATSDNGACDFESCSGCTDADACNYDPEAILDDGSCVQPDPILGCDCSLEGNISASLIGNASSEEYLFEGSSNSGISSVDIVLDFSSTGGSWPSDMAVSIKAPNGDCISFGGFSSGPAGCTSLGLGGDVWPSNWNTTTDGTYTASVDLTGSSLNGTGEWSLALYNGWLSSSEASYEVSFTLFGVCATDGEIAGCTTEFFCNYNPDATIDDGSCILPLGIVYVDEDGDGYGGDQAIADWCPPLESWLSLVSGDCDDSNVNVYPNAFGTGEGIDNNCNGVIDPSEEAPATCAEDVNEDGTVSVADILAILSDFGCTLECDADPNEDGAVNVNDILAVLAAFGTEC